jgi:hypothetical protein
MDAMKKLLKITFENAKLKGIWHYSLPSGWTCPGAKNCLTKSDKVTGKITDSQTPVDDISYRCYAAVDEARRPNVRALRWHNFDLIKAAKTVEEKTELICASIPEALRRVGGILRVHVGGDYFSYDYLRAWLAASAKFPRVRFYSYTKSIQFLAKYLETNKLPDNFVFTCSGGGKFDSLIPGLGVKQAKVYFSQEEIDALGLDVDHTDEFAIYGEKDFALLLHGQQPKGSASGEALKTLRRNGVRGYVNAA